MEATVPVHPGLFEQVGERAELLGGRCSACGQPHFPRMPGCPYCSSEEVTDDRFAGPGRLWAWTAVTAPPPGYRGSVPFGFGVVELPAGLRVIARLTEPDPGALSLGQSLDLVVDELHRDDEGRAVLTWAFAPEGRQ